MPATSIAESAAESPRSIEMLLTVSIAKKAIQSKGSRTNLRFKTDTILDTNSFMLLKFTPTIPNQSHSQYSCTTKVKLISKTARQINLFSLKNLFYLLKLYLCAEFRLMFLLILCTGNSCRSQMAHVFCSRSTTS